MIKDDCDEGVKKLCKELGWEEELELLYRKDHPLPEVNHPSSSLEAEGNESKEMRKR